MKWRQEVFILAGPRITPFTKTFTVPDRSLLITPVRGLELENSGHPVEALQIVSPFWLMIAGPFGLNCFNDPGFSDILESGAELFPQDIREGDHRLKRNKGIQLEERRLGKVKTRSTPRRQSAARVGYKPMAKVQNRQPGNLK